MGKKSRASKSPEKVERGNWPAVLGALVLLALFCGAFYYIYNRKTGPRDYEGKIVDRWADYAETDEGSRPFFRLRIESDEGKRFSVRVDPNVYESARVGMRIRSRGGQIVLIESNVNK